MPAPRIRPATESLLLLATSIALSILLVRSAGPGASRFPGFAWIAALPLLAVGLTALARDRQLHCLHTAVFASVLGSVGMLAGALLDFGWLGLAALADWCTALRRAGLDGFTSRVAPAPWTHLGMLAGCNLGMVLSAATRSPIDAGGPAPFTRVVCCNAGMIVGMIAAEALLPAPAADVAVMPAPLRMFVVMLLGMTAGMWGGWRIAELAPLRRSRGTREFAAPRRTPGPRI